MLVKILQTSRFLLDLAFNHKNKLIKTPENQEIYCDSFCLILFSIVFLHLWIKLKTLLKVNGFIDLSDNFLN